MARSTNTRVFRAIAVRRMQGQRGRNTIGKTKVQPGSAEKIRVWNPGLQRFVSGAEKRQGLAGVAAVFGAAFFPGALAFCLLIQR